MKMLQHLGLCDGEVSSFKTVEMVKGETENTVINIHDVERQEIFGFGGAFTEAAGLSYSLMSEANKKKALEMLFGESGLRYKFCRLCIGSSDFSIGEYSEVEEGDMTLETFNIDQDRKYIIPFVKDAIEFTKGNITFFASPWSPPAYMKDTGVLKEGGKLKKEFYELYAKYFVKFIQAYAEEGIKISAVTIQNEAHAVQTWESCIFDADDEAEFCNILFDQFEAAGLDVKIACWDHNKERLFERAQATFPKTGNKMWGISYHWYSGEHYDEIRLVREFFPDKAIIEGEFCRGLSSHGYMRYRDDILGNLAAGTNALCDWNLILDDEGGPFHNRALGCRAELFYDRAKDEIKTHGFHSDMYFFSHYIDAGAHVLASSSFSDHLKVLGVKNPDGKILCYVNNNGPDRIAFVMRYKDYEYTTTVEGGAAALLIFKE